MTNKFLTKVSKTVGDLTLFSFFGAILIFLACYLYVGPQLPAVETLKDIRLQTPMSVFTHDGQLLAKYGEKRRIPVSYEEIPEQLNHALIATEDRRFHSHGGVDAIGLARAVFQLVSTGRIGGGGSTITMQLARNFFLSFDQTFTRKTKEIFLSWKIERALSKQEILSLYWNKINFSNRAYGVGAAAQVYYGTTVDQLSLPQLAILAGIPKGPTTHNPLSNPEKALSRRNHVLRRMLKENYISPQEFENATNAPLTATYHGSRVTVRAPYIAEMVRREMISRFGKDKTYTSGFKVFTTLNAALQQVSRKSLRQALVNYDRRHGYRGAERHFSEVEQLILTLTQENLSLENSNNLTLTPKNVRPFDAILNDIPVLGGLIPALVISLSEKSAQLLLKKANRLSLLEDRLITIEWDGLSWARPFITESRRGKRPRTASQILARGDLIRTHKDAAGIWQLTQLPEVSAAFVALKPKNGAIVSLVGGFDYGFSKFNNVTQARRQPGSNIKPFIYSAAFEKGYTAATLVNDAPFTQVDISNENIWRPKNSSGNYNGPTRLRVALKSSTNLVSIRLIDDIGPQYAVDYLTKLGFERSKMPAFTSLALGAANFTPLEVVRGFAIFANGGYRVNPFFIHRIEDSNGNIIFEEQPLTVCKKCEQSSAQKSATHPNEKPTLLQQRAEELNLSLKNAEATLLAEINKEQSDSNRVGRSGVENSLNAIATNPHSSTKQQMGINLQKPKTSTPVNTFVADIHQKLQLLPEFPIEQHSVAPRVIAEDNVFLINSMMQDVIYHGTASPTLRRTKSPLLKRRDLAGKTGTTNEAKDAWFSGYNGDYVATAWVGYSNYSKGLGNNEFGGKAALPIWQQFMETALEGKPDNILPPPPGLITAKIDPATGLLAPAGMKGAIFETFRLRYLPTKFATKELIDPLSSEKPVDEEAIF